MAGEPMNCATSVRRHRHAEADDGDALLSLNDITDD